jgi:hypothetical protein
VRDLFFLSFCISTRSGGMLDDTARSHNYTNPALWTGTSGNGLRKGVLMASGDEWRSQSNDLQRKGSLPFYGYVLLQILDLSLVTMLKYS